MFRKKVAKGHSRVVFQPSLLRIKLEAVNNSGLTGGVIFRHTRKRTITRTTNNVFWKRSKNTSETSPNALQTNVYLQKRLKFEEDNFKVDFLKILFLYEPYSALD